MNAELDQSDREVVDAFLTFVDKMTFPAVENPSDGADFGRFREFATNIANAGWFHS